MSDGKDVVSAPVVNLAVCGDFGQLQLVPELDRLVHLQRVYYAARRSRNAAALGLSREQACNAYLKEYLIQGHARFLSHRGASTWYPLYEALWERTALRHWKACEVLHVVIQGAAAALVEKAKSEGAAIIGHPIMAHPDFYRRQLATELDFLGLNVPIESYAHSEANLRREISLTDSLFCLSSLVKDSFVSAGYSPDRVEIIRLPTDRSIFRPSTNAALPDVFRVLCVAEISPVKGHVYLLEAWRRLRLAKAELIFAGTMRPEMKPVLDRYEGLFRYVGPLGKAELVRTYQESSLLVLPSVQDGFGFVVAEAMSCGVPVIVTENTGAKDIVDDGTNGFTVPARHIDALADAILKVHRSPELRDRLRTGCLAAAETFPSAANTAEKLARLYRRARRSQG